MQWACAALFVLASGVFIGAIVLHPDHDGPGLLLAYVIGANGLGFAVAAAVGWSISRRERRHLRSFLGDR